MNNYQKNKLRPQKSLARRWCALLILTALSFPLFAQISFSVQTQSIRQVLKTIENNSSYRFFYNAKFPDLDKKVSLEISNQDIDVVLHRLFNQTQLTWEKKDNNQIVLKITAKRKVKGTVLDDKNIPVIGASIKIKNGEGGTITDIDGNFALEVDDKNILQISYMGYSAQDVTVGKRNDLLIMLMEDTKKLDEVIVVGYGTQKKVNLTGSVESLKGEVINKRVAGQVSNMLSGLAAGVTVTQQSGQPGKDQGSISIRGLGTMNNQSPLVLVDGIEEDLSNVDPNSVESISILKDAASSAIYGSRAANGVVLVTTKRAQEGKFSVTYNGYVGIQEPVALPNLVNAYDHMYYLNEAFTNSGKTPLYSSEYLTEYQSKMGTSGLYPNTNWKKLIMTDNGFRHNHSVSIAGGTDRVRFMGVYGYYDQNGLFDNVNYKRHNFRMNTDLKISSKLTAAFDANVVYSNQKEPSVGISNIFTSALRFPATTVAINDDGTWGEGWSWDNPMMNVVDGGQTTVSSPIVNLTGSLTYKPIEELALSVSYSPKYVAENTHHFVKANKQYNASGTARPDQKSSLTETSKSAFYDQFKAMANFNKRLSNHNIGALVGFQQETYSAQWLEGYRLGFAFPDYDVLDAGDITNDRKVSGSRESSTLRSVFGRVNYSFIDRYLFEANVRYDGSSRFAKNNRYAIFPSFSGAWRLTEESFMEGARNVLSNAKIRASWGQLGNQAIEGLYPTSSNISINNLSYIFNGMSSTGAALSDYANKNLTWERTSMTDIGLDLQFFNKLNVVFDWYYKVTDGVLMKPNIPLTMGYNKPYQNMGKIENRGWEISLNYRDKVGQLNYDITLNLSDVENKVLEMNGDKTAALTVNHEGHPMNSIYGYKALGLFGSDEEVAGHAYQFPTVKAGDIKYADLNGDKKITADDMTVIGSTIPHWTYSANVNLEYRGFDMNVLFQGVGKRDGYIHTYGIMPFYNGASIQDIHMDRYTNENKNVNATFPRFTDNEPNNTQNSTFWVKDASYFRLKNLQLGYSLPKNILAKAGIQKVRIYLSGENLFTATKFWKSYDPEAPIGYGDFYPQNRTYSLGLEFKF